MKLTISPGNSKLGKIPNISLPPIAACGNSKQCAKECYAVKPYRMYPNVKKAWNNNFVLHRLNLSYVDVEIRKFLDKKKPKYFRIHVSGDFLNQKHVDMWAGIAEDYKGTQFLAFTKMFNLTFPSSKNFRIYFSVWPTMNRAEYEDFLQDKPVAVVTAEDLKEYHKEDLRYLHFPKVCPGSCSDCKYCFEEVGDVIFKKH